MGLANIVQGADVLSRSIPSVKKYGFTHLVAVNGNAPRGNEDAAYLPSVYNGNFDSYGKAAPVAKPSNDKEGSEAVYGGDIADAIKYLKRNDSAYVLRSVRVEYNRSHQLPKAKEDGHSSVVYIIMPKGGEVQKSANILKAGKSDVDYKQQRNNPSYKDAKSLVDAITRYSAQARYTVRGYRGQEIAYRAGMQERGENSQFMNDLLSPPRPSSDAIQTASGSYIPAGNDFRFPQADRNSMYPVATKSPYTVDVKGIGAVIARMIIPSNAEKNFPASPSCVNSLDIHSNAKDMFPVAGKVYNPPQNIHALQAAKGQYMALALPATVTPWIQGAINYNAQRKL